MTDLEIKSVYDETYEEYLNMENKFKEYVTQIDDKFDEIYNYLYENNLDEFKKQKLTNSEKLSKMLEEKTPKNEYSNYIFSYFETLISCRNEMISRNRAIMIYSYLFNLTMFIELVVKNLIRTNNEHFKKTKEDLYWQKHDIRTIIESNKDNFKAIGLSDNCYGILISEVSKLYELTSITDIQQAFKYPIKKDFSTATIKDELLHLDIEKIKTMVENHKQLLFVCVIIYFLTSIDNNKWVIENIIIPSYNQLCLDFENMKT